MSDPVTRWLEQHGLGQYAEAFSENAIDIDVLPNLSDDDLKELGLLLGHRRKFQLALRSLDGYQPTVAEPKQYTTASDNSLEDKAERRQLTVMFCDLAGSTDLARKLDPEDLREVNRAYQDACKAGIDRYEGYVARYMGDGVLAYFGYPQAHEDDAERAIHAGLEVVSSLADLNQRVGNKHGKTLGVRVGIATGPVVVGDLIGEGASQESAVVGETPNLAARLQTMAGINSVVIGPGTHRLARGRFEFEDLGTAEVKGIAEAIRVWRVVGPSVAESRFEALHRDGVTPLVGRQHEIGLLLERWAYAKEGDGQIVLLSGEAGIGKSRIVETLLEHTAADGPIWLRYQCSPYHVNSALYPVIEQLKRAAQFKSEESPHVKFARIESLIHEAAQTVETVAPLFAHLLSVPLQDRYPSLEMSPEQRKEATLEVLVSQIEGLSGRRPVLLVFEDVHWADPTSLELLNLIVLRVQARPVMVVITFRPEFSPPWTSHSHITSLMLGRFSRSQASKMVDEVTGGKPLPEEVRDRIIEKTDGVALFVEELTKTVIDIGLIEDRGDHYALTGPLPALAIPNTLHDSLMARLDRSPLVREVAQVAAVIGREFSNDLLAAVSPFDASALQDALDQLTAAALIFRSGASPNARYVFKHALLQDAAYRSLLNAKRRELHAQIAKILEDDFSEKVETEPELLAHHYTEAGCAEPALQYWLQAGQQAIRQCAHTEAIAHLRRGLALVEELLPEGDVKVRNEIALRVALGVPLLGKEGAASPAVMQNYLRAQELCEQTGEKEKLYPILWGLWFHHFYKSELNKARDLADRLLEVVQSRDDVELRLEAHHCQWAVRFVSGDLKNALEHCEQGIHLYRADAHHVLTFTYGGHDPGVCARNVNGIVLWLLGFPERSQKVFDSALKLARELCHSATVADALQMAVELSSLCRDRDALEQQVSELLEFAVAEKMFDNQTLANGLRGWLMFQRGDVKSGLSLMRESAGAWLEQGPAMTAVPVSLVAESLGQMGEVQEALELVNECLRLGERDDGYWWESELYRVKGVILLKGGMPSRAEDSYSQAIETAKRQDAKSLELRTAVDLARLWQTQGRSGQAHALLQPIYHWFTEGFDTTDLKQAKALLEELRRDM